MKVVSIILAFALCLSFTNCSNSKNVQAAPDTLPATSLLPFGRWGITADKKLELISSAVHFGYSFRGTECRLYASLSDWQDHNYLQYELDGVYQKRLKVSKGTADPIIISANGTGQHTVWIYKATEAHTGPVFIEKVVATNVKSIAVPDAPMIEFIGNSITCGAAADASEMPCGTGVYHDQHNAYYAYGPRVARSLKANYMVSSVSGIGVYRNWNSDGPTMPEVYEKPDFQLTNKSQWDFARYAPKVVSIALGTNDYSNGDGKKKRDPFDTTIFIKTYVKFVQLVKAKYPSAQIALLSSPMINGDRRQTLQSCLTSVKMKVDQLFPAGKTVATFFFEPMQARGCGGHPSVEDHAILAQQLLPFFQKLMK